MMLTEKMKQKINSELNRYIKLNFNSLKFEPQTLVPFIFKSVSMTEIMPFETDNDFGFKGQAQAVYKKGEDEETTEIFFEGYAHIEENKEEKLEITIADNILLKKYK